MYGNNRAFRFRLSISDFFSVASLATQMELVNVRLGDCLLLLADFLGSSLPTSTLYRLSLSVFCRQVRSDEL